MMFSSRTPILLAPLGLLLALGGVLAAPAAAHAFAPATWLQEIVPDDVPIPEPVPEVDPEYIALYKQFQAALAGWANEIFEMRQARVKEEEWPIHPAFDYYPRFAVLADKDIGLALGWMSRYFEYGSMDQEQNVRGAKGVYRRIGEEFASESFVLEVLKRVPELSGQLGQDFCLEFCDLLVANSEVAENQAMALETQADMLSRGTRGKGRREVREIYRILVDGYAGTDAALRASHKLYSTVERNTLKELSRWAKSLEDLRDAGKLAGEWPPCALERAILEYLSLANAGNENAIRWVEVDFPAFQRAEAKGKGHGLVQLIDTIGLRYVRNQRGWMELRFRLIALVFAGFPEHPSSMKLLEDLRGSTDRMDTARIISTFEALESSKLDELRAHAYFFLGEAHAKVPTQASFEKAIEYYRRLLDEFPGNPLRPQARINLARMERVSPGRLAPNFRGGDQNGLVVDLEKYRGKVVLLCFGGFWSDEWKASLPREKALHGEFQGVDDFAMIGVNTDHRTKKQVLRMLRKGGVKWRQALQYERSGPILVDWNVTSFPTYIVVDRDGTIRSRNMPWDDMRALIRELLAKK